MILLRGKCASASAELLDWMEQHLQSDPALVAELHALAGCPSPGALSASVHSSQGTDIDHLQQTSSSFGGFANTTVPDFYPRSHSAAGLLETGPVNARSLLATPPRSALYPSWRSPSW